MRNVWVAPLAIQQVDGTAYTASTTPTSILPSQAKQNLAPNADLNTGSAFRLFAGGRISTAAATPGTLTLALMFGSVAVWSGTTGTLVTSGSNLTWRLELEGIIRAIATGVNSNLIGIGKLETFALSATLPEILLPATSPAVGTSFDNSLTTNTVDLFATWSANNANSIRCDMFKFFLEN